MRNILIFLVSMLLLASCAQQNRHVFMGKIYDTNGKCDYSMIERVLDYTVRGSTVETPEFTIFVDGESKNDWWNTENGAVIRIQTANRTELMVCRGHICKDFSYIDISFMLDGQVKRIKVCAFSFDVFTGW